MILNLNASLDSNAPANENDVLNTKRALNRLGLYTPTPSMGLHEFPDTRLFDSIRAFQSALGLRTSVQ
jgi:hypothetical protein